MGSTPNKAVPNGLSPGLRSKFYAIHLDLTLADALGYRKIGVIEAVAREAGKIEAVRLTDGLMKDIESYGVSRAQKTKISPQKIVGQFTVIAGLGTAGASALLPNLSLALAGQGSLERAMIAKIYGILLGEALAVANKYLNVGISDKVVQKAAEAEAARLTLKIIVDVDNYGTSRAKKAKVSHERITKQFTILAGFTVPASAKKTIGKSNK